MRNLKKVLSLVLVVAMLASMMIVGAAAADTEETKYPEAAAVISAIKVMEGDENGMRYGDTVTREEAAAIICRALLGDAAETLYTSTSPFADVAANRWSAKYISYLKAKGIVSGVSDTEFDPTANVTGIAFAKMLLTAVGYGKAGEFEGAQWYINTITFANQTGLYDGAKGVDVAAAATREECMLYAFNTIVGIPAVNYNKNFEAYYVGSNPLSEPDDKDPFTLAATNFKLDKAPSAANEYGRPSATWTVNGIAVVDAATSEAPVATYTNGTTAGVIYAALGKAVVDNATTIKYTVNGGNGGTLTLAANFLTPVGDLGDTVEVYSIYDGAGHYDVYVVVVSEFYATVKSVNAATKTVTLSNSSVIDGTAIDVTGLAKGDHVLYTKIAGTVKTVKEITPVAVTYTAYKAATAYTKATIVADGATYVLRIENEYTTSTDMNKLYDVCFDSLGNIVAMTPNAGVTQSYNYLYVADAAFAAAGDGILDTASAKIALKVIYPEGGAEVLNYAIYEFLGAKYISFNGNPALAIADFTNENIDTKIPAGWYTYTLDANGNVTLGALDANYAVEKNDIGLTKGSATVTGYTTKAAGPNTVVTRIDATTFAATNYTGFANFITEADLDNVLIVYAKGSNTIDRIIVPGVAAVATTPVYVYCANIGNTTALGTEYTFINPDGSKLDIVVPAIAGLTVGEICTVSITNGVYSVVEVTEGIANAGTVYNFFGIYAPQATVAKVEANNFTSVAVEAVADDPETEIDETVVAVDPVTYYFDAYTVVVDCTGNGATTISEGDIFVAATTTSNLTGYAGLNYCTYIWIVA